MRITFLHERNENGNYRHLLKGEIIKLFIFNRFGCHIVGNKYRIAYLFARPVTIVLTVYRYRYMTTLVHFAINLTSFVRQNVNSY